MGLFSFKSQNLGQQVLFCLLLTSFGGISRWFPFGPLLSPLTLNWVLGTKYSHWNLGFLKVPKLFSPRFKHWNFFKDLVNLGKGSQEILDTFSPRGLLELSRVFPFSFTLSFSQVPPLKFQFYLLKIINSLTFLSSKLF